jgi:hypothetical protein
MLSQASAQELPEAVYRPVTELDMTGAEVTATVEKPTGAIVRERKPAPFNPLVSLRTDFSPELRQSVSQVK